MTIMEPTTATGTRSSEDLIPHTSLNPEAGPSVLLIHGGFGDRDDWDLVTPHLNQYHLLLPDLPAHGQSRDLKPLSAEYAVQLLSKLIERKAVHGVVHVVGHSLGANIAVCLTQTYPHLVESMLISGYGNFPRTWLTPLAPYIMRAEMKIESAVPISIKRWLLDGTDIKTESVTEVNVDLVRQVFIDVMSPGCWPSKLSPRSLIIAATSRPSFDSPKAAKKLADIGRESNEGTFAVEHPKMKHPWNRQAPELFAETIRRWIEGQDLPDGFIRL